MVASEAIRCVSGNLAQAIREQEDMTSAHPLEHALSAYHDDQPHGVGLIMISRAFYSFFINKHICDDRFIEMAGLMGMKDADKPEDFITALVKLQEDCGVADLKMSDYGIMPEEFPEMAQNAKDILGVNFLNVPAFRPEISQKLEYTSIGKNAKIREFAMDKLIALELYGDRGKDEWRACGL